MPILVAMIREGTVDIPVVAATLLAAVVSALATGLVTTARSRRESKRQDDQRQADIAAFLDGIPPVPGVTAGASSAALRMAKVETGLGDVARGQALLERRMDEANGTGKRTEKMVRDIIEHLGMVTQ